MNLFIRSMAIMEMLDMAVIMEDTAEAMVDITDEDIIKSPWSKRSNETPLPC